MTWGRVAGERTREGFEMSQLEAGHEESWIRN
jgi:hypothetical protein